MYLPIDLIFFHIPTYLFNLFQAMTYVFINFFFYNFTESKRYNINISTIMDDSMITEMFTDLDYSKYIFYLYSFLIL